MRQTLDFKEQEQLFAIATQILEDYNIKEWSLGGGTALAAAYLNHRKSFDIDIFTEHIGNIQTLIDNKSIIAESLNISHTAVQESPSGITFILDDEGSQLKLDFLFRSSLTEMPYNYVDIFGIKNIKIQTIEEILAKKLKYRENVTVRDYVDFHYSHLNGVIDLSQLARKLLLDIDRCIEIVDIFDRMEVGFFDMELHYMEPIGIQTKYDVKGTVYSLIEFGDTIEIAYDNSGEIVAFDNFIERYSEAYEIGGYYTTTVNRLEVEKLLAISGRYLNYKDIYGKNISSIQR
jgi:hypothetical protein